MEDMTLQQNLCYLLRQCRISVMDIINLIITLNTEEKLTEKLMLITQIGIEEKGDYKNIKKRLHEQNLFKSIDNIEEALINAHFIDGNTINTLLTYSLLEKNFEKEDIIGIIYPIINNELAQRSMLLEVINNNYTIEELLKLSAYMHENYIFK